MNRLRNPTNTHDASIAASLRAIAGFATFVAALGLFTACGGDDDDDTGNLPSIDPNEEVATYGEGEAGPAWSTQYDPATNRTFRCIYGYSSSNYDYAGGPYIFCYEPEEGELP